MTELNDEQLGAYLDGELSTSESAAVKQAILRDPQLRKRVEQMQESSSQLNAAFNVVLNEPVPEKILTMFSAPRRSARRAALPAAVAASIALIIGGVGGFWVGQVGEPPVNSRAWVATLQIGSSGLLDSTPSGAPTPWHGTFGEMEVQPVLSFRDRTGRICRQYLLTNRRASSDRVDGIACRTDGGTWQVLAARLSTAEAPDSPEYTVASGPATSPVDALVNALASAVIAPEEERDMLRAGWR